MIACRLAGTGTHIVSDMQVDIAAVRATVTALVDCLIRTSPGLTCGLAKSTMAVGLPWTPRYVGVLRTVNCNPEHPEPYIVSDFSRFVWNFLASATATGPAALANGLPAC